MGVFAYEPELDQFLSEDRLATVELLRSSIATRTMVLHFQPKLTLATGVLLGIGLALS